MAFVPAHGSATRLAELALVGPAPVVAAHVGLATPGDLLCLHQENRCKRGAVRFSTILAPAVGLTRREEARNVSDGLGLSRSVRCGVELTCMMGAPVVEYRTAPDTVSTV